ncbi:uncharacterized protein TNCV_2519211 [Trichonephila clavipes]|nr:uncharacterized protein TNCV_2519211 [Trichonephila clavipes]
MDHVILNHGKGTWTTPELAPPAPNYQREDISALDRFSVHRCPTRVFSGTGLELMTKVATIRYLYHSATVTTFCRQDGEPMEANFNSCPPSPNNHTQTGGRFSSRQMAEMPKMGVG